MKELERDVSQLENKVRFILAVIDKTLVVSNRPKADIIKELKKEGYATFSKSKSPKKKEKERKEDDETKEGTENYDYLLGMKIWCLTKERVKQLRVRPSFFFLQLG